MASELTLRGWQPEPPASHVVLVPIGGMQRAVVKALRYARDALDGRARGVRGHRSGGDRTLRRQWDEWGQGVQLVVLDSPYRSLMEPLLEYIERGAGERPDGYVTVVLPEFVPRRLWHHLLHNQHALLIKGALLFKPNVVVTSVPFHLGRNGTGAGRQRAGPTSPGAARNLAYAARAISPMAFTRTSSSRGRMNTCGVMRTPCTPAAVAVDRVRPDAVLVEQRLRRGQRASRP